MVDSSIKMKKDVGAAPRVLLYQLGTESSNSMENILEHDYGCNPALFTQAALAEKQSIIAPALLEAFTSATPSDASSVDRFDKDKHMMIDIGCGPFMLGIPFLRKGITVHGVDIEHEMLLQAQATLIQCGFNDSSIKLYSDYSGIGKSRYKVGMMNFVHQCCADRESLTALFEQARYLISKGGKLLLTGTHPDYLHVPHSFCEYDVKDSSKMKDGDPYTGRIFDGMGNSTYELKGDYYWSINTITEVAKDVGFNLLEAKSVNDKTTLVSSRVASESPAYMLMTFKKNGLYPT